MKDSFCLTLSIGITVMYVNFGIPKIINFLFGTYGKLVILGVTILNHIMVNIVIFFVFGC